MRAIQFSRDVGRQATATKCRSSKLSIGCCRKKVTTKGEENFDLSIVHRLNGLDCVVAVISRRLEIKYFAKLFEKRFSGAFPNTHGAIALHVAVTSHRTHTRARFPDLSAQKHQVHDLLNVRDRVLVLREAHGPTADRAL